MIPAGPPQVGVLPAAEHDAAVALWHRCGLTRPWNDPAADLRRALDGPSSTVLAAYDPQRRLTGTVMVGHEGHRGWLYYLAVDPGCRGEGLGRVLVRAAEHWLAAHVPKVQLMVRADNAGAVSFWTRLGYETSQVTVLGRRLDGP